MKDSFKFFLDVKILVRGSEMDIRREYKYIVKPGWPGETPIYHVPELNELVRVLFDQDIGGTKNFAVWLTGFEPGQALPLHKHSSEELLFILSGKGVETVGEETREVDPYTAIYIPPGVEHRFINTGDEYVMMLVVAAPPGDIEKGLYKDPGKAKRVRKVTPRMEIEYE
jgi:quercetin dioxygenase-like cupin family protein